MSTIRFFSGSRELRKGGIASEQMRFEIQKKGKLPAGERYKRMLKKKLEENKQKVYGGQGQGFSLSQPIVRKMSKRTENTLKEIAARKAAKEAKAMRKMVVVTPRVYPNGRITQKGQIYDMVGNSVARVNTKNGKIQTQWGTYIGKYKPKSYFTDINIQNAINLHSPYFIQQRRLQQQGVNPVLVHGPMGAAETVNIYGKQSQEAAPLTYENTYGSNPIGPRQNIGVTAWGAASDNVWGTFADNAWGQSADNVWGTNSSDVWGGIGPGNLWGMRGPHIWGTGSGKNYIKGISNAIAALFGFSTKKNRESLATYRASRGSGGGARTAAPATRAPSAPAPTRR
jgi:hypothetical protein